MSETYDDLKKKTVADLREIAKQHEHDALSGYSSMKKPELIEAVATALGLTEEAAPAPAKSAPKPAAKAVPKAKSGKSIRTMDKNELKQRIHELRAERTAALEAHDSPRLHRVRRRIHRLKRRMRAIARRAA